MRLLRRTKLDFIRLKKKQKKSVFLIFVIDQDEVGFHQAGEKV
jgi:hypothetical protein